jgi:meso-butanediol dehydrogenase / (S,S)-butanediol dehydrogenase / diacetyl reductase
MGRLSGKSVIISGAGSGIGRGFAHALAAEGAKVGVLDLNESAAQTVVDAINKSGASAMALQANVAKRAEVKAAFEKFVGWAGKLDVLFNNAGFNKPMPLLEVTEDNWHAIMDVNGLGVLIGIQEGAKLMIPNKSGKIINTASIAGRQGYPSFAPYCASKFAVNALTQAGARGLAEHNITVNSFAPGVVATPLWDGLNKDLYAMGEAKTPDSAMDEFGAGILKGHAAAPEELAGTAVFLASSDSDYMTGQTIMIDGGMVLL